MRKSRTFQDKELLDQQVNNSNLVNIKSDEFLLGREDEMYQMEIQRKIVEEYIQHVNEIKLEHQVELDKGRHN